jgi:SAM-dependent methyltransferase
MDRAVGVANTVACRLCHRPTSAIIFRLPNGNLHYCAACDLLFSGATPSAESHASYYNDSYRVDRDRLKASTRRKAPAILDYLGKFVETGSLLEIGCSYGFFLAAARQRGWRVVGVELSSAAAAYARTEQGLDVRFGTLDQPDLSRDGPFDAIVLLHVLEHLLDPVAALEVIRRLLAPNGIAYIATPNLSSLEYRLLRSWWLWVDPRAHVCLFSPQSLRTLFERCGFRLAGLSTERGDSLGLLVGGAAVPWRYVARLTSLGSTVGTAATLRSSGTELLPRVLRPVDLVTHPARWLAYRSLLGPELRVIGVRDR